MNRQLHAEFEALSALPVDELTQEEWMLLQIHLSYCSLCTERFEQYQQIASQLIPASATFKEPALESAASFTAAEKRLMDRVSWESPRPAAFPIAHMASWKVLSGVLAACTLGLVALLGANHLQRSRQTTVAAAPAKSFLASPTETSGPLQAAFAKSQSKVAALQQEVQTSELRNSQAVSAAETAQEQLKTERALQGQVDSERDGLRQQLASAQAETQSWKDKANSATSGTALQTSQREALENKVHLLNVALSEKDAALDANERMLALDNDFLAHDRDIRDLIGARNLYISDIIDMAESGKTAKPFGRIFYTKDRSLVFYGFDLDKQAGLTQAASFQAWGSGSDKQPVSLGMFYQDDSHKRWELRCSDAKALARLNMVFVTVEPPGGSTKPTGKQMLRAYLQIQPNHP